MACKDGPHHAWVKYDERGKPLAQWFCSYCKKRRRAKDLTVFWKDRRDIGDL